MFLKKKGVEREVLRKKELLAQAAVAPLPPSITPVGDTTIHEQTQPLIAPASESQSAIADSTFELQATSKGSKPVSSSDNGHALSGVDIPQQSIEVAKILLLALRPFD